jgi:DNA-binding PadR family transcriptional regulator
MDALSRAILQELADGRPRSAQQLATHLEARHWADLSTALANLVSSGYIRVTGPLGRAETTYRIHARGRAALSS